METISVKRNYKNDYQSRTARVQLDYESSVHTEENGTYNVWYSKWSMDGSKFNKEKKAAATRCVVERDAGRTKASPKQPFCIHFAHGRCTRGPNCTFLHRIPMPGDRIETTIDCFGREKFRTDRDDMGGIGSFERRCKTLYIGNIGTNDHLEEIIRAHFSEWGEMEYGTGRSLTLVNVLTEKGVAFVQYKSILNAEFAKEAMQDQRLESEDESNKRKAEKEVIETIKAQLPIIGEKGTILDYQDTYKAAGKKSTKYKEHSGREDDGTFFGGDLDTWQAYCEQYFEHYGHYPKGAEPEQEPGEPAGNAVYAIPQPAASLAPAQKKLLLADYASDSD
ncbi:Pre-mRNA-splicing factor [Kappamyces sp. JEL0829]|nr:Pre-mRNA-splicing factor [Kappamyces sp. JEL0829]